MKHGKLKTGDIVVFVRHNKILVRRAIETGENMVIIKGSIRLWEDLFGRDSPEFASTITIQGNPFGEICFAPLPKDEFIPPIDLKRYE